MQQTFFEVNLDNELFICAFWEGMIALPKMVSRKRDFPNGVVIHTSSSALCENTGGDVWKGVRPHGNVSLTCESFVLMEALMEVIEAKAAETLRVLELGCGTAYLGISFARAFVADVVVTDQGYMEEIVAKNISSNPLRESSKISFRVLDWREPDSDILREHYDIVLAADVIYDEDFVLPLVRTLEICVRPSSTGYMCLSHRAERLEQDFFSEIEKQFIVEDLTNSLSLRKDLGKSIITVFKLNKKRQDEEAKK